NNIKKLEAIQNIEVRSILKLKYDTPYNIVHHESFNKLKLLTVSNRIFELSERYVGTGLSHSIPLVVRLVKEYKEGFESRYIEYLTPLCETSENEIKDNEGRFLLKEKDLIPKNNIAVNELVPRTLTKQIDGRATSWETTYDVIKKAPFRPEPLKKRVYGVPTIRNDIPAPEFKKIQDRTNYGTDGTAWSLLSPSVFSHHGVYEKDVLQPRPKETIRQIMSNIGYNLSEEQFESTWNMAKNLNPYGQVSIEEFRWALNDNGSSFIKIQPASVN
ncbi:EF-hand domain-containing family member B, partial [Brachionus plicatilis]